ncbi:hypothetical protein [Prescottella subtropica]|uniref:hypothetical protein n=1 Tax=Prescottella subtropica TaxID=2545757 RepID=UPI0010F6F471|nr:hypothetical protein [Prescottella subtropica]
MTTRFSPEPEQPHRSRRSAWKSARPTLAAGAVALSVLGLSQISTTSASFQDTAAATSGGLTVAGNVLPAVASVAGANSTWKWVLTNIDKCVLSWTHLNAAYKYHVIVAGTGQNWDVTPSSNQVGQQVSTDIWKDNTPNAGNGSQTHTVEIHTVNTATGEESTDWRGYTVKRQGASAWHVTCGSATSNVNNARMAPDSSPVDEKPAAVETAPTTAPSTTDTSSTKPTDATAATTTTPSPTTTTTSTTTPADTPLEDAQKSPSGYTATLVQSAESGAAIVIEDANSNELQRISVSVSATYEWDESTDTLWITDGGKQYKASGSSWTKTVVEQPSDETSSDAAPAADTAPTADTALTE